MKVGLDWLREWVALGDDVAELSHALTMAGFEVEGRSLAAPPSTEVVIGEIVAANPHPQADKLRVCDVIGRDGERLQIVCGAPNARAGIKVPLARVGARLPNDVAIRRAKLRGVESFGMLCSARELGLGEEHDGIMELPIDAPTGGDFRQYLKLDESVLEINFTPNRGDALSVLGLARELGVIGGTAVCLPRIDAVAASHDQTFPVRVEDPTACPRFAGRVVRGVDPTATTPLYIEERLRRAGLRSLGPLVDVTNYVMLELGQPMHAYDLRRLSGGIVVRAARAGETLELLDGSEVALTPDMLVIADAEAPVGLAGVMGGRKSGIAPDTTDVFLEAAHFAPDAIAGRGRRLGVLTDASQRFERGVDPEGIVRAMERATALLVDIAGGSVGPLDLVEAAGAIKVRPTIILRARQIERLLGVAVAAQRVEAILTGLGMQVEAVEGGHRVVPPSWRFDLSQEADLIEEVARIVGYNEIPDIDAPMPQRPRPVPEGVIAVQRFALALVDRGYVEAINYTFVDPGWQAKVHPGAATLALKNPISAELAEMRVSLWPGLLKGLRDNLNRQQTRVRMFEHGAKFVVQANELKEINCISGLAYGTVSAEQWATPSTPLDFYDVKSDVESLLALSRAGAIDRFVVAHLPCLHPGRCARIERDGRALGWIGELHPELAREFGFSRAPVLFELELAVLSQASLPRARELSRYPAVRRDLAVVVDESISFDALVESVTVGSDAALSDVRVFDVYRGKGVETGRKSVALGLIFQDKNKTLTDADVETALSGIRQRLQRDLNAVFRD